MLEWEECGLESDGHLASADEYDDTMESTRLGRIISSEKNAKKVRTIAFIIER
jgi:hypothetical protein